MTAATSYGHRSAEDSAILILIIHELRSAGKITEPVIRIEAGIPEELEGSPMKVIGAAFRDDIHIGAWIAPVACIEGGRLNLEFRNGIRIRNCK